MKAKKGKIFFTVSIILLIVTALFTVCLKTGKTRDLIPLNQTAINIFSYCEESFIDIFKIHVSPYSRNFTAGLVNYETTVNNLGMVFIAILAGVSLAVAGSAYQGVFRNPLVSPTVLGIITSSTLGLMFYMIMHPNEMGNMNAGMFSTVYIFGFGGLTIVLVLSTLSGGKNRSVSDILLMGTVVASFAGSILNYFKFVMASPEIMQQFMMYTMGHIFSLKMEDIKYVYFLQIFFGIVPLVLLRSCINVITFGDEEAKALGINAKAVRLVVLVSGTVLITSTVIECGNIGWIGLIVPHICRFFIGPDFKVLIPASIIGGAVLLLFSYVVTTELSCFFGYIPITLITSCIGAPMFFYLLIKRRKGVE